MSQSKQPTKQEAHAAQAEAIARVKAQRWEQELLTRLRYAPKQVNEDGRSWVFKR